MGAATISGYTTTFNCQRMHYPLRECLESLLGFGGKARRVLSGRNAELAWRDLLLEPVDCDRELTLHGQGKPLGDRLVLYYAAP